MQTVSSQRTPLTEEEFEGLIEDIQAVINRLSAIHDREHDDWRLQTDRSAWETAKILDVLQQYKDRMDRGVSAMFIGIHDEGERKDADSETTE